MKRGGAWGAVLASVFVGIAAVPASASRASAALPVPTIVGNIHYLTAWAGLSADGRYFVFDSTDTNLGVGTDAGADVFRYDRQTGTFALVSALPNGGDAPGNSDFPSISDDGRYVAFESDAPLVNGVPGGTRQIYVRDMRSNTTVLASVGNAHITYGIRPAISGNGRYVAFRSDEPSGVFYSYYVRDLVAHTTKQVPGSDTDTGSFPPSMSDDGRYVAVSPTDPPIVVADMLTNKTEVVPHPSWMTESSLGRFMISGNGRYVAYSASSFTHLAVLVFDRVTGALTSLPTHDAVGITDDGRMVASTNTGGNNLFDLRSGARQNAAGLCSPGVQGVAVAGTTVAYRTSSDTFVASMPGVAARPYWLTASDGGVFTYGGASFFGSAATLPLRAPIVGIAVAPDHRGYSLVASDGGVFTYGSARFFGSLGNVRLRAPIVGMAATPDGRGYWLVASDGGVFAFGSARFFGSLGNVHLAAPIASMTATPDGRGYWLVGRDGGVFTFGDAAFRGAGVTGAPAVSIAATTDGAGYWVTQSNGGVRAFGTAANLGSLPAAGVTPAAPVVAANSAIDTCGFRMAATDGGVFTFGGSGYEGSAANLPLHAPIVGIG
jgi:hypothetical protein